MQRAPIETATIHEWKRNKSWPARAAYFRRTTGGELDRGEDATPIADVIEAGQNLRVTLLAVADGIGGYHAGRYYRSNSSRQGVTTPRLAAELTLEATRKAVVRNLDELAGTPADKINNTLFREIISGLRGASRRLLNGDLLVGRRAHRAKDGALLLGGTTLTTLLFLERKTERSFHAFFSGDSPFAIQVGACVRYSPHFLSRTHLLDSSISYGRTRAGGPDFSCGFDHMCAQIGDTEAPVALMAFSDAVCFRDEAELRSGLSPLLFRQGRPPLHDLEHLRYAGRRAGCKGDDLSGAYASIPGEWNVQGEPDFKKIC